MRPPVREKLASGPGRLCPTSAIWIGLAETPPTRVLAKPAAAGSEATRANETWGLRVCMSATLTCTRQPANPSDVR